MPSASPTPSPTPAGPTPTPAQLLNISTRVDVHTGDNVGIGGFIIRGNASKKVIVGGLGPSLQSKAQPVAGRLADPIVELHDENAIIATNDNWKDSQQAEIEATGLAPKNERKAAIVRTLAPGSYTAILRGKDNSTGIALIQAYDVDQQAGSRPGKPKHARFSRNGQQGSDRWFNHRQSHRRREDRYPRARPVLAQPAAEHAR
jgi:hypothetical protein